MENRPKHTGLTMLGIYFSFLFSFGFLIWSFYFIIAPLYPYGFSVNVLPFQLIGVFIFIWIFSSLFFVYHFSTFKEKNYLLVALISFVPSLLLGGLLILIDGKRSLNETLHNTNKASRFSLELQLKEIDNLFELRIITKEEYDLKRKDIISRY